jgi:hypothetical protein
MRALILALICALVPTLALAQGMAVGPNTRVENTYRWLDGKQRNLGGLRYDGRDLTVVRNVIRFWDEKDSNTVVRNSAASTSRAGMFTSRTSSRRGQARRSASGARRPPRASPVAIGRMGASR